MRIATRKTDDARVCVVDVRGEIDVSTAPDLESVLSAEVNRGCVNLVLDLSRVSYADSSALGLIVAMNRLLEPRGGRLVLAGATRNVTRVLELSGLVGAAPTVLTASDADGAVVGLTLSRTTEQPQWTVASELPASSSSLAQMRAEVSDMLEPLPLSEAARFDVRVAVGEALSNAVRHGSPRGEGDIVGVTVSAYADRVIVTVADRGGGFDGQAPHGGDPYASSGRGVMFMRALMDDVEFRRLPEGGTEVVLVKHLDAAGLPDPL